MPSKCSMSVWSQKGLFIQSLIPLFLHPFIFMQSFIHSAIHSVSHSPSPFNSSYPKPAQNLSFFVLSRSGTVLRRKGTWHETTGAADPTRASDIACLECGAGFAPKSCGQCGTEQVGFQFPVKIWKLRTQFVAGII